MPPKRKFTKEEIINTGFCILREKGIKAVTARAVGERLGSSSKIIFTVFESMEALKREIEKAAWNYYSAYINTAMENDKNLPYKASGKAYISFAENEKELFRYLFMDGRKNSDMDKSLDGVIENLCRQTGFSKEKALRFHLDLWVCVHGIAAMTATGSFDFDEELRDSILNDIYMGVKQKYITEEEKSGSNQNREAYKKI